MSHELRAFLGEKGIATSRTTSYNPEGNGQVERYNGVVWNAITMCLKSRNLPTKCWQDVLPDVLHSIRSLLCTATNETPHERFFRFPRRSSTGASIPTWMAKPGPVLLKRHVRSSKTEPLVDEVELLEANPHYAHVRYPDGRETTVSTKHLAPRGQIMSPETPLKANVTIETAEAPPSEAHTTLPMETRVDESGKSLQVEHPTDVEQPVLRCSERAHCPVDRLDL